MQIKQCGFRHIVETNNIVHNILESQPSGTQDEDILEEIKDIQLNKSTPMSFPVNSVDNKMISEGIDYCTNIMGSIKEMRDNFSSLLYKYKSKYTEDFDKLSKEEKIINKPMTSLAIKEVSTPKNNSSDSRSTLSVLSIKEKACMTSYSGSKGFRITKKLVKSKRKENTNINI